MKNKNNMQRRKGVVIVLVTVVLLALVGFIALAVDVGMIYTAKNELQNAVDAAALAAARGLSTDQATARQMAIEYAAKNFADGHPLNMLQTDVQLGLWESGAFTPLSSSDDRATAVQITGRLDDSRGTAVQLYFAKIFGLDHINLSASAVAVFGSRDIVVVLDYSGSMSDDSELKHIPQMGQSEVEGYLADIWDDLRAEDSANLADVAATDMNNAQRTITSENYNTIMRNLGLRFEDEDGETVDIPYPYPPRTWSDYFNYVQRDRISNNIWNIVPSSHENRYGYLTWMDYLQAVQYIYEDHSVPLYATPQQPITAVKDAVTIFLAYMQQQPTDDRVALASYTYSDGGGHIEQILTDNYTAIESASRDLHAGYYDAYTNIAGGIEAARTELNSRGRESALRFIVLLSDGVANRPGGESSGRAAALAQADSAANERYPIVTISLGAAADTDLMQEIADRTRGVHFIVPAGDDVADYEDDLFAIFRLIADHRALKLVN